MIDLTALTERWELRWPGCRPISYELRGCRADRWVRFHSLPRSKRYPDDEVEMREVLRRHRTILDELSGGQEALPLLAVSTRWRGEGELAPSDAAVEELLDAPETWWSGAVDETDAESGFVDVQASMISDGDTLDTLLTLVARDEAKGVVLAPADLEWLFAPYDGGADVILRSTSDRDALRDRHHEWLSSHPSGL